MKKNFNLSAFNKLNKVQLTAQTSLLGDVLKVNFNCLDYKEKWNVSSNFSKQSSYKNWKLWDYDVFEIFIQFRNNKSDFTAPYIEMQVSPNNQKLNLLIIKPREIYQTLLSDQFKANIIQDPRSISVEIHLSSLDLNNDEYIYGAFFSCLGPNENRSYFSNIDLDGKLDFHRPKNFVRIK